tara:strand:+ start:621 stop:1025 length:405 start_codon:yes stop_codon:yes gene_type:complete
MDYEKLLDEAYKNVKETKSTGERFAIPKLEIRIVGNKTVISNFAQITSNIRRNSEDLCKFFSKELAAMCKLDGERLILNRKIPESQIQNKFKVYVEKYVLCKECKKPDTELIKKEGLTFVHCLACGAKHSLGRS